MKYQLPTTAQPLPNAIHMPGTPCPHDHFTPDEIFLAFLRFYRNYGDLDTPAFREVISREVNSAIADQIEEGSLPFSVTLLTEW